MYHKIHRWTDEDSVEVEPDDVPLRPQEREEREVEDLPGEGRRLPVAVEE